MSTDDELRKQWRHNQRARRATLSDRQLLEELADRLEGLTLTLQHWINETIRLGKSESNQAIEINKLGSRIRGVETAHDTIRGMVAIGVDREDKNR